jgi:hypothetical protein
VTDKTPPDYRSPFDRPVKPRALWRPIFKHPGLRAGYWIVCLGLIGALLWYIRSSLDAVLK